MNLEEGPFVFRVNDNGLGPNLLIQVCLERGWKEFNDDSPISQRWNLWWKTQAFPVSHQKPLMSWQVTGIFMLQVCLERGWREYNESIPAKDGWNLWWKTSAFSISQHKHLKAWQFTNHIPKGASICRKDNLARNLKCMRKVYGAIYDISEFPWGYSFSKFKLQLHIYLSHRGQTARVRFNQDVGNEFVKRALFCHLSTHTPGRILLSSQNPQGYNLPLEYTKLVADCSRRDDDEDESQKVWICKPVGQSQGRGIFLFKSLSDLCYYSNAVVQKYIKNPLLIGGYKFDLRLYVCVPSYHPLTIYLYKEGLVRFSTDKFSLSDLNNPFCHLTNSSLNKLGPGYAEQKDRIGAGCKWNFKQLRQYFQQSGIRDWLLWQKISALVTLTILSQSTSVPQTTNCFEFYGFDVLIDEKLKPWLLEVNLSPALGNDCDIDPVVKKPLLHDLFDLLGLPICNTGLSLFTIFLPFEDQSETFNTSNSENENSNESEHQRMCLVRAKQKSAPSMSCRMMINRTGSGVKTATSSALLVATAATKWRKKRKSSYLFGPPKRNSMDYDKIKLEKEQLRAPMSATGSLNLLSESSKAKEQPKSDEKKSLDKVNELSTVRKGLGSGKRNRDSNEKIKVCNSAIEMQNRGKIKCEGHSPAKAISCTDNSKVLKRFENVGDNKGKKKKKLEVLVADPKHGKCRTESKSVYAYERPKKVYPNQIESSTKTVVFPIDKSSVGRGFRGRTKAHSPMLWGNGKDWTTPTHREGDWNRIYPFNNFNSKYTPTFEEDYQGNKFSVGDKQIRLVVHHVTNFIKVSKQIYYKGIDATEEELNSQLINHLGMTGDVWLPSK